MDILFFFYALSGGIQGYQIPFFQITTTRNNMHGRLAQSQFFLNSELFTIVVKDAYDHQNKIKEYS